MDDRLYDRYTTEGWQIECYICTHVAYRTDMHSLRSRRRCHMLVGDPCYRIECLE